MKNAKCLGCSLFLFATWGLVFAGCDRPTSRSDSGEIALTRVAVSTKKDCCGKCSSEDVTAVVSSDCGDCGKGCDASAAGNVEGCKHSNNVAKEEATENVNEVAPAATEVTHVNSMPEDRNLFHDLLENHGKITREVTELKNGIKTVTESLDPVLASKIQHHVASMVGRVEDGRPIRMWDKLYQEIFRHADKIEMKIENTEHGILVTETSNDDYVVKLIKAHAKVVSGFAKRGFDEARENHQPPEK